MAVEKLKKQIIGEVEKAFEKAFSRKLKKAELAFPPDVKFGDFAVEFFSSAKDLGMSPAEIAKKAEENFETGDLIENIKAAGPYLNIKVNNKKLFGAVIGKIEKEKEKFGDAEMGKGQKVMIEYLSPNTNKPLHLGHTRNGSIGMSLAGIMRTSGYDVKKAILVNDRGVHISKSMLAWQKWGNGETPENVKMKGDHFVGKYYVKYAKELEKNPELEKEIQEMLKKWEAGDAKIMRLWKIMNEWFYEGFDETCAKYGFLFDEKFYESETYKLGKDIIEKGLEKKIFRKDASGSVIFDLPEEEFGRDKNGELKKQTVLRADGTSVYMTQDLGTAVSRFEKYELDKLIYVVGSEQIFHFKVLFKILELLGYPWAKNLFHFAHGMVTLPEGKMKSREGIIVDADDLLLEVEKIVADGIKERNPDISDGEINVRAKKIALGAIKFQMLRVKPGQDIQFNPKESVAIDGFTGPYCQYAYARICGILQNAKGKKLPKNADFDFLGNEDELKLIQKLMRFPEEIEKAALELNPLRIVAATYEICQAFNLFYNNNQVIDEKNQKLTLARLKLAEATGIAVKKGLNLLEIGVLERM